MKKIIVAFGGSSYSNGIVQFARKLNEIHPLLLVGVFLPELVYSDIYSVGSGIPASYLPPLLSTDEAAVQKKMDHFADMCQRHEIAYRVHRAVDDMPLAELTEETRFADLMIISSEKFYRPLGFNDPNPSLRETLHASECPVIVVPEHFHFPARNILAYDGSESSLFAIKQFAYLFPELCEHETLLVHVEDEGDTSMPQEDKMTELMAQHFTHLSQTNLRLNRKEDFTSWLNKKRDAILVGGSFGRSLASQFFRKSFVSEVIEEHKLPVFIAHT